MDGGRPALPLGTPSARRKRQLADRYDVVVVTGDVIHAQDEHYGQLHDLTAAEIASLRPSEFFLDGLGSELERQCPVVWSAAGAPFDLSGADATRMRAALEGRPHISVRDDASRDRLLAIGATNDIAVVPDPTVLASRLFPSDVLRKRIEYLRVLGCFPSKGRPVLLQGELRPEITRAAAASFGNRAIVLADPQGVDDTAIAAKTTRIFRLPAHASLEDITAAIANAQAVIGPTSSVATAFGVPALVATGRDAAPELSQGPATLAELQTRVDAEFDTIAELAERSWSKRVEEDGRRPVMLAQALIQSQERYQALLEAHAARGERLVNERMRFAEIVDGLDASNGALPPDAAERIAELENAVFIAQAAEAEVRFELEQLREGQKRGA